MSLTAETILLVLLSRIICKFCYYSLFNLQQNSTILNSLLFDLQLSDWLYLSYLFLCAQLIKHFFNLAMPVFLNFTERLMCCCHKLRPADLIQQRENVMEWRPVVWLGTPATYDHNINNHSSISSVRQKSQLQSYLAYNRKKLNKVTAICALNITEQLITNETYMTVLIAFFTFPLESWWSLNCWSAS